MWTAPQPNEFQAYFARDFNKAPANDQNNLDYVTTADITKATNQALINFNPDLYGTNDQITLVFMWLVAFYLVYDLQTSAKGLAAQSKFPISGTSVGGVSINFQIPERFSKDPILNVFTQNGYGMKYLSLALPYLVGHVGVIGGTTTYT